MIALSPYLHQAHCRSRQVRIALMLARRSQRGLRHPPPLMTPDLRHLGHNSPPSRALATTGRSTNTRGASNTNHSAPSSPPPTRSTETLGRKFHFMARISRNHADYRQASARYSHRIRKHHRSAAVALLAMLAPHSTRRRDRLSTSATTKACTWNVCKLHHLWNASSAKSCVT